MKLIKYKINNNKTYFRNDDKEIIGFDGFFNIYRHPSKNPIGYYYTPLKSTFIYYI